jgi:acyl-CoA hydrolase
VRLGECGAPADLGQRRTGGHRRRRTDGAGGKSVITLRSTYSAKDPDTGERRLQSRILPVLPEGAVVTLTRSNTHFVATEYGAVCLRGLTVPQRAKALISIAHPDFRDWLEEEFHRIYRL